MKRKHISIAACFLSLLFFNQIFAQVDQLVFLNNSFDHVYLKQLSAAAKGNKSLFYRVASDNDSANRSAKFSLLPINIKALQGNSFLNSINDEQFLPTRGSQLMFDVGIKFSNKFLSVQLQPRFLHMNTNKTDSFPMGYSDRIWYWYFDEYQRIDRPFNFGSSQNKFFPGNSHVKFNLKKISFGISSESNWIGPGYYNSLVMTNTAPGLPHYFARTRKPLNLRIFSLEFDLQGGLLHRSGIMIPQKKIAGLPLLQDTTDNVYDRYLNALSLTIQPAFSKNLFLGISRVVYSNYDKFHNILDLFPTLVLGRNPTAIATVFDQRDQMLVLSFRALFPTSGLEIYGEFGRNDYAKNIRDFLMNPDHSAAFIAGIKKRVGKQQAQQKLITFEVAKLEGSLSYSALYRGQEGWYRHNQVRKGYTNHGQIIGAGIGTGSNSIHSELISFKNENLKSRISFNYIWNNNDFLNNAFKASSNKRSWTALNLSYTRYMNISPFSAMMFRMGILSEQNRFWYDQAKDEVSGYLNNKISHFISPTIGIHYTYKLN